MKTTVALALFLWASVLHLVAAPGPGDLDETFVPATAISDVFWGLAIQSDGRVFVSGRENAAPPYSQTYVGVVYQLNTNGTANAGFQSGPASCTDSTIPQINAIGLYTNGTSPKALIGGAFTYYNNRSTDVSRLRLARIDSVRGTLDSDFTPGANNSVNALAVQSDGKILIGGSFTNFRGSGQNYIARLNQDGTADTTFNTGSGPDATVRTLVLQPDGTILIGGDFKKVGGVACLHIARLDAFGNVDASFNSSAGPDDSVYAIAVQPNDGQVVIGGYFLNIGGQPHSRIGRLNPNGTLDSSFNAGCDSYVWALAVQNDAKIVAGGRFNNVGGRKKVARFNSDGTVDTNFNASVGSSTGTSDEVRALKIQDDGKIVVAGKFTVFNNETRHGIARLYGDPLSTPPPQGPSNTQLTPSQVYVPIGAPVQFTATTEGVLPITCTWYFNDTAVWTNPAPPFAFIIPSIQATNYGRYHVVMQNAGGTNQSSVALVEPPQIQIGTNRAVHVLCQTNFVLQASTNLVNWTSIATNATEFADTNWHSQMFFKVASP